jgi:hypothetical protein
VEATREGRGGTEEAVVVIYDAIVSTRSDASSSLSDLLFKVGVAHGMDFDGG